jgi:xanthine phosphoribosyltransferase
VSHTKREAISWLQIKEDSLNLADLIRHKARAPLPTRILAVTRGGLIPASLVARALGITQIETIGLASYEGEKHSGVITELKKADTAYLKDTIIVDDLVDTGKTFEYLRPRTSECIFATLYAKPMGEKMTDFYVKSFDQECWIDFPWEA